MANEEAKRRQEEEERLKNATVTPNLGSSTAGINTGDSVVDGLISEMNKDLGVSDPQVWVDKYPLADWQLTKFLENLPTPRNDKEISNISSFWVLSHARNWVLSPATSWLVITEDVRKIWRDQINNKLNLKMTGNGDNAKIITQSGGVLRGGSDHP